MGKSWRTKKQTVWLEARYDAFVEAQAAGTAESFLKTVVVDFFDIWKTQDVEIGESEVEQKERDDAKALKDSLSKKKTGQDIPPENVGAPPPPPKPTIERMDHDEWKSSRRSSVRNWFRNHKAATTTKTPHLKISVAKGNGGSRLNSDVEIYTKHYYDQHVKESFEKAVQEGNIPYPEQLALRNRMIREAFENETDEIKEKIAAKQSEQKTLGKKTVETIQAMIDDNAERTKDRSPEEKAIFLANVVGVLKGVINLLAPNTGWCWTFIGGGPDPRKVDAQLTSITYHHGVTPDGRNLGQYAPTMQPLVMVPFSKFLRAVYSLDVQLQQAIKKGPLSLASHVTELENQLLAGGNPEETVENEDMSVLSDSLPVGQVSNKGKKPEPGPSSAEPKSKLTPPSAPPPAPVVPPSGPLPPVPVPCASKIVTPTPGVTSQALQQQQIPSIAPVAVAPQVVPSGMGQAPLLQHAMPNTNTALPNAMMGSAPAGSQFPQIVPGQTTGYVPAAAPSDYQYPNMYNLPGMGSGSDGWQEMADVMGTVPFNVEVDFTQFPQTSEEWARLADSLGPIDDTPVLPLVPPNEPPLMYQGGLYLSPAPELAPEGLAVGQMIAQNVNALNIPSFAPGGIAAHPYSANPPMPVASQQFLPQGPPVSHQNIPSNTFAPGLVYHAPVGVTGGHYIPPQQGQVAPAAPAHAPVASNVVPGFQLPQAAPAPQPSLPAGPQVLDKAPEVTSAASILPAPPAPTTHATGTPPPAPQPTPKIAPVVNTEDPGIQGPSSSGVIERDPDDGKKRKGDDDVHDEPREKRARRGRHDLPDWVDPLRTYLLGEMEGAGWEKWERCVELWFKFEEDNILLAGRGVARLSGTTKRPAEVSKWMNCRPRKLVDPSISNLGDFEARWVEWWTEMQPDWRKEQVMKGWPDKLKASENLAALKKAGTAGISLVLVSLRWWAKGRKEGSKWESAVDDVATSFVHMADRL